MRTIAVTVDDPTLNDIDEIMAADDTPWRSRSELVRQALREFIVRLERAAEEEREREVFRKHRARLNRQVTALVKEQAKL